MDTETKIDNFKAELQALLEKYRASIGCNVDGDTHGLSYEMVVTLSGADKWKESKLCSGAEVDWTNIK